MRVQAYSVREGTITITVATQRGQPMASTKFTAANIHEDYTAAVLALLREHKQIVDTTELFPMPQRLQTYLPTYGGQPLYAVRELQFAGAPMDIDDPWQLEITRIRYAITLHMLPAAWLADESIAEAIGRNVTYGLKQLFDTNGIPSAFIPGDEEVRPGSGTSIDIICELGAAGGRGPVEIPTP